MEGGGAENQTNLWAKPKKQLCSGIPTDPNFWPYPKNVDFFLKILH